MCREVLSSILQSYTLPLQEEEQDGTPPPPNTSRQCKHVLESQAAKQANDGARPGPSNSEFHTMSTHVPFRMFQILRSLQVGRVLSLTATTSLSFFQWHSGWSESVGARLCKRALFYLYLLHACRVRSQSAAFLRRGKASATRAMRGCVQACSRPNSSSRCCFVLACLRVRGLEFGYPSFHPSQASVA